jgi:hypothetical protein
VPFLHRFTNYHESYIGLAKRCCVCQQEKLFIVRTSQDGHQKIGQPIRRLTTPWFKFKDKKKTSKITHEVLADRITQDTISFHLKLKLLPGDDMDLHGKLPLVLLQFKQTEVTDLQTVVTNKCRPASPQKPPVATRNLHFGLPDLPLALEHRGLLSSWKMSSSIFCAEFLISYKIGG